MSQPDRRSLKATALHSLLGGFALGGAAILALAPSAAQVSQSSASKASPTKQR